jgi:hypothetical protein
MQLQQQQEQPMPLPVKIERAADVEFCWLTKSH